MGWYIPGPPKGKADYIVRKHGAQRLPGKPASFNDIPKDNGKPAALIVVVDNGAFEAAGFCYSPDEFEQFTVPGDWRPKEFLWMPWDRAVELTGYKARAGEDPPFVSGVTG